MEVGIGVGWVREGGWMVSVVACSHARRPTDAIQSAQSQHLVVGQLAAAGIQELLQVALQAALGALALGGVHLGQPVVFLSGW